jgi:hypothetical protein
MVAITLTSLPDIEQRGRNIRPRIVLWAWERPENLEYIDPREISVAFLASTIRLREDETVVKPRLQPLKVAPGTEIIAVARIESDHAALSRKQLETAVSAASRLAQLDRVGAIQIDFDARESERPFYREFLQSLRRQLPSKTRLTITALASWCIYDDWMAGLPIDEATPMLFRLGAERHEIRSYLASGETFRSPLCRNSLGVSTDEPLPRRPAMNSGRVYAFNPRPWSAASANEILKEWRQ